MALTLKAIRALAPKERDYKKADEKGLYLLVKKTGVMSWHFKYRIDGSEKKRSYGLYPEVTLTEARNRRDEDREKLRQGIDPRPIRKQIKPFGEFAETWLAQLSPMSESNRARLERIVRRDLIPELAGEDIDTLSTNPARLLETIRIIENRGAIVTAKRANLYAGQIFRYAIACQLCYADPSTLIKDALKKPPKPKHFAAITEKKAFGKLLQAIDEYQGSIIVKTALKLQPMLFCRPRELRYLEKNEINWAENRIEIPAEKMKMDNDHIIPLSTQALSIFKEYLELDITREIKYVFPSARMDGRPMSENALRAALRTMGFDNDTQTPHGFRASARTLLDEELEYPAHLIEHQLAHSVKDPNGRAYNRTKHIAQRVEMMQAWSDFIESIKK